MLIVSKNPSTFAPSGQFVSTVTGTEQSAAAPYVYGSANFEDVTLSSASLAWEYVPGGITDEDAVTYPVEIEGAYKIAKVTNGKASKEFRLSLAVSGGATYPRLVDFVTGSYAEFSWLLLQSKMDATGKTKPLLSGGAYSSTCWAADYDWSGVSRHAQRGTAITRRHVWLTKHYSYRVGTVLTFLAGDGSTVTRTVIGTAYQGAASDYTQDHFVAVLDSALPESVTHYPIAGDWLISSAPSGGGGYEQFLVASFLWVDQNNNVLFSPSVSAPSFHVVSGTEPEGGSFSVRYYETNCAPDFVPQYAPIFEEYETWMKYPVPGDSGSPVFAPLSASAMALATCMTGQQGGEGPNESVLNALIVAANDNAVANGHTRPTDYEVTVAPNPTL